MNTVRWKNSCVTLVCPIVAAHSFQYKRVWVNAAIIWAFDCSNAKGRATETYNSMDFTHAINVIRERPRRPLPSCAGVTQNTHTRRCRSCCHNASNLFHQLCTIGLGLAPIALPVKACCPALLNVRKCSNKAHLRSEGPYFSLPYATVVAATAVVHLVKALAAHSAAVVYV